MTKTYSERIPLATIDPTAEDGEFEVTFTVDTTHFNIRDCYYVIRDSLIPMGLAPHEEDRVQEWLDDNFEGERA